MRFTGTPVNRRVSGFERGSGVLSVKCGRESDYMQTFTQTEETASNSDPSGRLCTTSNRAIRGTLHVPAAMCRRGGGVPSQDASCLWLSPKFI